MSLALKGFSSPSKLGNFGNFISSKLPQSMHICDRLNVSVKAEASEVPGIQSGALDPNKMVQKESLKLDGPPKPPVVKSKGGIVEKGTVVSFVDWPVKGIPADRNDQNRCDEAFDAVCAEAQSYSSSGGKLELGKAQENLSLVEWNVLLNSIEEELRYRKAYSRYLDEYAKSGRARLRSMRSDYNQKFNKPSGQKPDGEKPGG